MMITIRDAPQLQQAFDTVVGRVPVAYVVCAMLCCRGGHEGRSVSTDHRVTLWSTRALFAYVVCAIICPFGGHDGHDLRRAAVAASVLHCGQYGRVPGAYI
jgi:hypothetical protein